MKKNCAAYGLINTLSGQHLAVHFKDDNTYALPGGKVIGAEHPLKTVTREIYEQTGLKFQEDDFKLQFIETREENNTRIELYAYLCTKVISDAAPIARFSKDITPLFLEPRVFYTLTKYKNFYNHIFRT